MNTKPIENMLSLLRTIKHLDPHWTVENFLAQLFPHDFASQARAMAEINEQAELALVTIQFSDLDDEVKDGLTAIFAKVAALFSLGSAGASVKGNIGELDGRIATVATLLSAWRVRVAAVPLEAQSLAAEIDKLAALFDAPEIDPGVRATAKKHLAVLAGFLRNVNIFGMETALSAYFDLIMHLRRAEAAAPPQSQEKTKAAWEWIGGLKDKLATISSIVTSGSKLLQTGAQGLDLITT